MPHLDVFTVKVTALITIFVASMAAWYAWSINRGVAGMKQLASGLFVLSCGGLLGLARLVISGRAILIGCNALMLAGMIITVQGVREFRGLSRIRWTTMAALLATVGSLFLYWMFGRPSFQMRVAVISAAYSVLCANAALAMFRGAPVRGRLNYLITGAAFTSTAIMFLLRAGNAAAGKLGNNLLSGGPVDAAQTIVASLGCLGCVFGMLMAANSQLREESEKMAKLDPLTNLPNRRFVRELFIEAERRARTTGEKIGVIYMDLDDFKQINDALGHAAGDDLLRRIGGVATDALDDGQCLARIGGDEFLVFMEGVKERAEVMATAERLKVEVERQTIVFGRRETVRVSSGVAVFPEDGRNIDDLMRAADVAMYQVKGRKRRGEKIVAIR